MTDHGRPGGGDYSARARAGHGGAGEHSAGPVRAHVELVVEVAAGAVQDQAGPLGGVAELKMRRMIQYDFTVILSRKKMYVGCTKMHVAQLNV